jgi:RNA polymerase sigma-70 factor (ECF subfamily)
MTGSFFRKRAMRTDPTKQTATAPADEYNDEHELLDGLIDGDAKAWSEFNRRYSRMLSACIGRVVHRFSRSVGSDAAKEVYSTLCLSLIAQDKRRLRSFERDRGTKLGTWLAMLAVHTAYDHLRSLRRRPAGIPIEKFADIAETAPLPEDLCAQQQRTEIVERILDKLTDKDRQFMLLHFGHGLAPEQVALEMGISVKTVYTKKHKLRGRLEAMLYKYRTAA